MSLTILQRIAAGESAAVDECIATYGRLVWSLARQFLPNYADAEDVVQEVYLEVWRVAGRFDPAKGTEATYIATLARRRLIDRLRRNRRTARQTSLSPDYEVAASEECDKLETAEDVLRAKEHLQRLRPQQRQVVELLAEGLSHSEIAAATQFPLGTVKTHARRGLARLREMLGVSGDSPPADESARRSAAKGQ